MSFNFSILNPLNNPIFLPVIYRVVIVFLLGFFLIVAYNGFRFRGLFRSNVGKRFIGWLIIVPIYILAIFLGGSFSILVLLIILILAILEISKITKLPKGYVFALFVFCFVSVYIANYQARFFYSLPLFYFSFLSLVVILRNDNKKGFFDLSVSMFVSIWIIFSLSHFVLLGHLNNELDSTKSLFVLLGFAVPLGDVLAYVCGNFFHKINFLDKYKIASRLSPNKTYAGASGNILGAYLGVFIVFFAIKGYLPFYHWLIIAFLIGFFGVAGDILESTFKRYYGVKDSGSLLIGHGGLLDRIDSMMRVVVVVYYYLALFL